MTSVDNIINSLILSYNTSDIKKLPEDLREALYKEAKKCLEKSETADNPKRCNERKTLMRLINNNQLNKKPVSDLIKGPLSITLHWNSDMKMMIYIFGEVHSSKTDCEVFPQEKYINGEKVPVKSMFIEDYMKELLINTDSYIDFFLEEKAHIGYDPILTNDENVNRLQILRNTFRECISDIKSRNTNPNCNLSRSHYFDIRQGTVKGQFDVVSQLITELYILNNIYTKNQDIEEFIIRFDNIREKFSYFIKQIITNSSNTAFVTFWKDTLFDYPFLKEKMKRSSQYSYIELFIKDEIKLESLKYKETMQDTIQKLFYVLKKVGTDKQELDTNKCEKERERIIRYVCRFQEALIMVNSTIADGYLLSRVFKEFDINTDKTEKKRGFDEPQRPHNIIIYGGNVHANRCRKFLETIKFKRLEQNIYDDSMTVSNCVDMKNIIQPLFSYIPDDDCVYYKEPYIPINIKRL
jgi:hypothetical protein